MKQSRPPQTRMPSKSQLPADTAESSQLLPDPEVYKGLWNSADQLAELARTVAAGRARLEALNTRLLRAEASMHPLELHTQPTMVWCIDNFDLCYQQAKAGQLQQLVSEPFSTEPCSYRMRMSAFPAGESKVRGRFLTVFVCLTAGPYDNLLEWPFNRRIYITAMDQSGEGRHHTRLLIPKNLEPANLPYLRKPHGGQSPWFGIKDFLELARLENGGRFVRGNRLYLRVEVPLEMPLDWDSRTGGLKD